ncbi:hypothetical protein BDB00DRAFT_867161 [Zychaea mexicana]|uniref:uncharacterized protein n=1 Tax=Zychaea mexicana TaxID=64656 RepID=UPI0022FE8CC4|nr:uncharacterized protein BDB00DRAFT_867161 [Zychaea mexicana]KAI9499093.1 hypothetical protein BDB00DRAFT_867161 [Zychaea mexicana]
MAHKRSHFIALFFSMFALVLLIFANLGITVDNSPILQKVYIAQGSQTKTDQSIRYGFYSSCIFKNDSTVDSCTPKTMMYTLDIDQLAAVNNIDLSVNAKIKQVVEDYAGGTLKVQKIMVMILPSAILSFTGMVVGMMMRRMRKNNVLPTIGALASLAGAVCGGVAVGIGVVLYRTVFEELARSVDGIMYYYGPAIYIVGAACGCQVIAFGFFIASCFARRSAREHNHSYEYYERHSYSSDTPNMHQHRY